MGLKTHKKNVKKVRKESNKNKNIGIKFSEMPVVDTTKISSSLLITPLRNIEVNTESINLEHKLVKMVDRRNQLEKVKHISPQKDFYTFINYRWVREKQKELKKVKNYFVKLDDFRILQNTVNYQIIDLTKNFIKENGDTKLGKRVKNVYESMFHTRKDKVNKDNIMNKHEIEIKETIDNYCDKGDLIGFLAWVNKNEIVSWGCPISWVITNDEKDAVNIRSHIDSPGLSFYDYELYIYKGNESKKYSDKFREDFNNKFKRFIIDLFDAVLGKNNYDINPQDIIDCEIDILKSMDCYTENDSPDFYNVLTQGESMKLGFDWNSFAKQVGFEKVPETFIAGSKSYIKCMMALLKSDWTNKKWRAYWYYMYYRQTALFSPISHDVRYNFFKKEVEGQPSIIPAEIFPIFGLSYCYNALLSKLYIEKHVHPGYVHYTQTMGEDMRKVFLQIIKRNDWMQASTKRAAIQKLEHIRIDCVYPAYMVDDADIDYPENDAWGIMVAQSEHKIKLLIKNEGKHYLEFPVLNFNVNGGMTLAGTQPYIVNAFYDAVKNSIYVPAAIIQPPFVDLDQHGIEYNVAHIGYTFGHELSHCLDNSGRLYDYKGNMNNWWTEKDEKIFNRKVDDVVKQYELFASYDGIKMDASGMTGENIADISGLAICVEYLNDYMLQKGAIVVIKELVYEKFFTFIAFQWREVIYKEAIRFNIQTNPHPLVQYRTNCPLARIEIFKKIYKVVKGDRMYWNSDTIF